MTITFDPFGNVWVASGNHDGTPYVAEGSDPGDAYNNAVLCARAAARKRAERGGA